MEGFEHHRSPSEKRDPIRHRRRYDVFLSFRGPDVRNTLVNKLFQSLEQTGLHVFLDSERLEKGENIGMGLEEAIRDSRILIPILSPGYASSAWCLKELSLMWSYKTRCAGTHLIPLFYNVKPWKVRNPYDERSPYAEALNRHRLQERHSQEEMDGWQAALEEVSSLLGWEASGDEDKIVQRVTEYSQTYKIRDLYIAKYPVGLATRTSEVVKELLRIADQQRRITFGIWGMGGSGKTTFSKSIYNDIHHKFQASCFVADIRAMARESAMGLRNLQKHILKNLANCNVDFNSVESVDQVKIEMQNRLASIRALIVLDDVDDDEQLDALLGDWYGPGSIIIITTRDKEVLQQRQVDEIQAMGGLNREEGVKLFSWHTFGRESPQKDYEDMTQQIVGACDGLPLSLEVLGAHLCSKMNLRIWEEALQKIQSVRYDKLYKSLRISYDALTFDEQQIFLDIACFFIGFRRLSLGSVFLEEFYVKFWEVIGREAVYTSLKNLEGKSLILMDEYTSDGENAIEFRMHDHLRDLGRQIVKEESRGKPHIRSRLWHKEDIISAIGQAEETSTVQGIMWSGSYDFDVEIVDSLSSMHELKFMFCRDLFLKKGITKLPHNLRYLVLYGCGLKQRTSFSRMPSPKESYCPKAIGQLKYLRYLRMDGTPLRFLPDEFGQLLSLEELYLVKCDLVELPHSFRNLIKLKFLNIYCNGLKSFPANFSQLRSLEYLDASGNDFEELQALPEGLIHLDVSWCARLQKLHDTHLHTLHSLTKLILEGCVDLKELPALPPSLTKSSLYYCWSLQRMCCMRNMKNLRCLELECGGLGELPEFEGLQSLKDLKLYNWKKKKLPILLPSGLIHLSLIICDRLIELPCMSHMRDLETLDLYGCKSLIEIPKLDTMHSLRRLILDFCYKLEKLPALPAGPIHVSTEGCSKLQNNSDDEDDEGMGSTDDEDEQSVSEEGTRSTDERKRPVVGLNDEFILLDVKRRRVREHSEVSEEGTSAAPQEIFKPLTK